MKKCLLLLSFSGLLGCHKNDPNPTEQLPPATQTGADTFGCLVNGQAWTPKGNNGNANYSVYYDPSYAKGTLSIAAYRYGEQENDKQTIGIYSDSVKGPGIYVLDKPGRRGSTLVNRLTGCDYNNRNPGTFHKSTLVITRLDLSAGIVSGTFSFTLYKPGCDTIKVTQGRFDKKL